MKNRRENIKSKKKKNENSFFVFQKLAKVTLKTHYSLFKPRQQAKESGKFWKYIPNKLKNEFIKHANRKRLLDKIKEMTDTEVIKRECYSTHNHTTEGLCMIFDDYCLKSNFSSSNEEYNRTSDDYTTKGSLSPEDEEYKRIFDYYIIWD
ncbi:hypothetical protein C1646_766329 [Rhizophagus diaphanus]|nr:hypothetical protein C1646_766329 [Rhizophagus diaphanus] [Rhizophagus sp. MUCL 43196]